MSGKFIVFEGVEGCGKTTQLQRTHQWLLESGWVMRLQAAIGLQRLLITREPGGTDLGREIRQMLLETVTQEPIANQTELLLYMADRSQHVQQLLKPELDRGALILCDRYTDSTVAYQGYGRGLNLEMIHYLNQLATDGLESDLTLWLDLDVIQGLERAQKRGKRDRIEQADLTFHHRVQQGFAALAVAHPHRIVRIDASPSEIEVAEQIQRVLEQKLEEWYA